VASAVTSRQNLATDRSFETKEFFVCTNHRHSIFCILPPRVLRNIALNGKDEERRAALKTLALDNTIRTSRIVHALAGALKMPHPMDAIAAPTPKRSIYDANHAETLPGTLKRGEGEAQSSDTAVNQAYDGLGDTFKFYLDAYNRNSIDNAGLPLVASVHYGDKYDNAFWNG
jgi:Zn-dependent metalloprotease